MMTMDCSHETLAELRSALEAERRQGNIKFGVHVQEEALITCVVPSIHQSNHVHFIDGADGGYVKAADDLKTAGPGPEPAN